MSLQGAEHQINFDTTMQAPCLGAPAAHDSLLRRNALDFDGLRRNPTNDMERFDVL